MNITIDSMNTAYDYIIQNMGYLDSCPFKHNLIDVLKQSLSHHIKCQDQAIQTIIKSISSWEFQRRLGLSRALLLVFTGPTGVGKSETAYRIGEALLSRSTPIGVTRRRHPKGLLVIRGEDYISNKYRDRIHSQRPTTTLQNTKSGGHSSSSSTSDDVSSDGESNNLYHFHINELKQELVTTIGTHIKNCQNNAIIIVDEIQKIAPGILEILIPAFDSHGSLHIPGQPDPVYTTNCIFIFISDIAADTMLKLILSYKNRDYIPQDVLRQKVKYALDEQWERLKFGGMVDEIVPFMPLEENHLQVILKHKLDQLALSYKNIYWKDLIIDDNVIQELVSSKNIGYTSYTANIATTRNNMTTTTSTTTTSTSSSSSSASSSSNISDKNPVYSHESHTMRFSTWGARSLDHAGPIDDIRGVLFQYMQPWQSHLILHMGQVDSWTTTTTTTSSSSSSTSSSSVSLIHTPDHHSSSLLQKIKHKSHQHFNRVKRMNHGEIYLQWCTPHPDYLILKQPTVLSSPDTVKSSFTTCQQTASEESLNNDTILPSCCTTEENNTTNSDENSNDKLLSNTVTSSKSLTSTSTVVNTNIRDSDSDSDSSSGVTNGIHEYKITDDIAFSSHCETIWYGLLSGS